MFENEQGPDTEFTGELPAPSRSARYKAIVTKIDTMIQEYLDSTMFTAQPVYTGEVTRTPRTVTSISPEHTNALTTLLSLRRYYSFEAPRIP